MKILIVGGGSMGTTYALSFTHNHTVTKSDLYILEHLPEKAEKFLMMGFKNSVTNVGEFIGEMQLIILAVKPQDRWSMYEKIKGYVQPNQVVLSIMAGVQITEIQQALNTNKIVRAMPNLPAQIGMGMTGFASSKEVTKEELLFVQNLLNTTGKSIYFEEEAKLDAVTAISGSGPAYVFYFMQAMIETAKSMGFTETQADLMVEQTFSGAVNLLQMNDLTCQEWIQRVASRGGTTEAALKKFEGDRLQQSIFNGLQAALKRAVELGSAKPA
jgi:pyrroline-5-carboxylate reductase